MMKSLKYRSFNDDRLSVWILRKLCAEVAGVAEVMRGGKTNSMVGPLRIRQIQARKQIQAPGWLKKGEVGKGASVWKLQGLDGASSVPAFPPTPASHLVCCAFQPLSYHTVTVSCFPIQSWHPPWAGVYLGAVGEECHYESSAIFVCMKVASRHIPLLPSDFPISNKVASLPSLLETIV